MRILLGMLLLTFTVLPAAADELDVVLNGKAVHLNDGNYNEKNWGLGLNYDFNERDKWVRFLHSSVFKDSNNQTSKYAGGGTKRRFHFGAGTDGWHADVGVIAFLMTRHDYHDNNPFFGALPFVAVGNKWVTVNATYIPSISPKHVPLLFFQAMVRIAEF